MGFFDERENVEEYIRMSEGYDGKALLEILEPSLPKGAAVLEIGMGPGKDMALLAERYRVTGSDLSIRFLERYREKHPDADLLQMDAVTLKTERTFDGIYSNKVLIHLKKEDLVRSLLRQWEILNPGGVALHSFWLGDREEFYDDLRFVYYKPEALAALIPEGFSLIRCESYKEFDDQDSFYCLLRKKGS